MGSVTGKSVKLYSLSGEADHVHHLPHQQQRRQQQQQQRQQNEDRRRSTGEEGNVNNAHNRYSSSDVGVQFGSTLSLFYVRSSSSSTGEFRIQRINVSIENKPITVDETSRSVLKYKTPRFRAKATVEVPKLAAGSGRVEVGWIQVCHQMQCVNLYGCEGLTSWEFPEIVLGKYEMVSDSDGKQYPFYGTKHEVRTIEGPTNEATSVTVVMHDNFFPQITWHVPAKGYSHEPRLTHVYRRQKFYTFLAVRQTVKDDQRTDRRENSSIKILHAVEWNMEVDIKVDPTLPLGFRVKTVRPKLQEEVAILEAESHSLLQTNALFPPNANNSQALIWRPFTSSSSKKPSVIVKPVHSTISIDAYLDKTKEFGNRLIHNWIALNRIITAL